MDSLLGKDHFTKIFLNLIEKVRSNSGEYSDTNSNDKPFEFGTSLTQLIIDITNQDSHPKKCVLILCYGIKHHIVEFTDFVLGGSVDTQDCKDRYNYNINTLFNEKYQNLIDTISERITTHDSWAIDHLVNVYKFDISKPDMFPKGQTFLMKAISSNYDAQIELGKEFHNEDTLIEFIGFVRNYIEYNIKNNLPDLDSKKDSTKNDTDVSFLSEEQKSQVSEKIIEYFNLVDDENKNILHYAAEKNYFKLVKYIQETYTQNCGGTKLGLFVESNDKYYPYDYAKSLEIKHYLYKLKNDSNPRLLTLSTDKPLGTFNVFDDTKTFEVEYYTEGKHIKLHFTTSGVKLTNITSNFEFEF